MKRFKNIILGILVAGMLTVAAPVGGISAYASSAKISFSDPSATVGQEFSVNVKISSQDGNTQGHPTWYFPMIRRSLSL